MALEVIISIFVTPMKRHLSYAFQCDSQVQNLEDAVEQLKFKKERLEQSVAEATRNGEEIYVNVSSWLSTVENDIGEAEELIQGIEEAKKKRCVGVCPDLKTRYQRSKKADKKASVIGKLVRDAERLDPISFRPPLQQIVEPSRLPILDQIMDALKDPQLNTIGVHGVDDTLTRNLEEDATHKKMFEKVVLVDVSRAPEVRRLQSDIAHCLGLNFEGEDVSVRASELHQRLTKSKVLVILDNLPHKLDLNAVGIPSGDGCKLLLTSWEVDVLRNEMGTQKEFSLGVLGEEEAWQLFCVLVPKSLDPQFGEIATKISRCCAGLPHRINHFAEILKDSELHEWKAMLQEQSWSRNKQLYGSEYMVKLKSMLEKVLESSSKNRHDEEMKLLLLLCSMFEYSNIEIKRLLMYSMGLGLFKNTVTVREARNRLFTLIDELKSESLLLDGDMDGFVQMHDALCGDAISIASKVHHFFVGEGQVRLGDQIDRKCTKIVLPYCKISELPSGLECPEADLFSLSTEDLSLKMPPSFFEGMKNLKVVDFIGMRFMFPPSSLGSLTNLRTLSLHKCRLHNVAFIGKLKQLQQLSFAYSTIFKLPGEIQELTQLKLLDLSHCTMLQLIPANVLSKLCRLEELYMLASFHRWDAKGNASLVELKSLDQLSALEIHIENPKLIPEFLGFFDGLKLEHFRISITDERFSMVMESFNS